MYALRVTLEQEFFLEMHILGGTGTALQVSVLAAKPDDLISIPGIQTVGKES